MSRWASACSWSRLRITEPSTNSTMDTAAGQGGDDQVLAADVVRRRGQAAERGTVEDPRVRAVGQ
jgi:hypothetical protein